MYGNTRLHLVRSWILAAALTVAFAPASSSVARPVEASSADWVGTWGSAQQIVEPKNSLPAEVLHNVTIRQVVRVSIGGSSIRLRVSNAFGTEPLHVNSVHVARPIDSASGRIDANSDRVVKFSDREDVLIPAGAELTSDPLNLAVDPLSLLAVTMQIEQVPEQETGHPGSRTNSYVSTKSSPAAAELQDAKMLEHWYFLSAIDVPAKKGAAVVTLGDSITDGRGSTTNGNDRWPDVLANQLQKSAATRHIGVLNVGIGGNRLLNDGIGPNALARFDRDVLARNGVRYLIVLEGVNDLGTLTRDSEVSKAQHDELVRRMIQSYQEIIVRAHTHGIKVFGATIMPYGGSEYYHPTALNEADRQAVNAWIRAPGHFDAVIDFDKLTANPQQPDRLKAEFDVGDGLHPSAAGHRAMGEEVSLALFKR
jgi:lysophospholipase L1-like esterase